MIGDDESGTYWDHITGEAFYGHHQGKVLSFREPLQYMTAEQVLANFPDAQTAQDISIRLRLLTPLLRRMLGAKGQLIPPFLKSMAAEDERRPRLELGVGLWTSEKEAVFYPMKMLKKHGYLLTELDRRGVLIYIDPVSKSPDAIFYDGDMATWDNVKLRLADSRIIVNKILYNTSGEPQAVERPHYLLTRWYGFALTFPQCQVYA